MGHTSDERTAATERRRLFADLVSSGRFCCDTRAGGMLHRGEVSLREVSAGDSLHVCVDGDRVSVHVDHYSPVAGSNPDGTCRYSIGAVLAHVVAHLSDQLRRLAHGQRGRHRCRLECELVDVDDDDATTVNDAACHDSPSASRPARVRMAPLRGRSRGRPATSEEDAMPPDPVLPNPSGTGPLPGAPEGATVLPNASPAPDVPPSESDIEDPSPGEPPVIEGGAEPA